MSVRSVAIGIVCKTPAPGLSKTRLSPPLSPQECAELAACFIRDVSRAANEVARDAGATPYAIYTPAGTEDALRALLPSGFRLLLQREGDLGVRMAAATRELLASHTGVVLIGTDSPTMPPAILRAAVEATPRGDNVTLCPAADGGYTAISVSRFHARLYEDVPWSGPDVYRVTIERAKEIGLPVVELPGWYDVDDAASLAMLEAELAGTRLTGRGADAPSTRAWLAARREAARK